MPNTIIKTININKYFYDPVKFRVLTDINLQIEEGEFVSVVGKSGCGKSTLLYILSTMDTDYEGELIIHNTNLSKKQIKTWLLSAMNISDSCFSFITCLQNTMF